MCWHQIWGHVDIYTELGILALLMKHQSDPTDTLEACGNIALPLEEEKEYTLKFKLNTNLSGKNGFW